MELLDTLYIEWYLQVVLPIGVVVEIVGYSAVYCSTKGYVNETVSLGRSTEYRTPYQYIFVFIFILRRLLVYLMYSNIYNIYYIILLYIYSNIYCIQYTIVYYSTIYYSTNIISCCYIQAYHIQLYHTHTCTYTYTYYIYYLIINKYIQV